MIYYMYILYYIYIVIYIYRLHIIQIIYIYISMTFRDRQQLRQSQGTREPSPRVPLRGWSPTKPRDLYENFA